MHERILISRGGSSSNQLKKKKKCPEIITVWFKIVYNVQKISAVFACFRDKNVKRQSTLPANWSYHVEKKKPDFMAENGHV